MFATTTTGHIPNVQITKETRTLQTMYINNQSAKVIQWTTTTTENWVGLSFADAQSVCVSSEDLGGVRLIMSSGMATNWVIVQGCRGTVVTSTMQRMGNTNCYSVQKVTRVMTCTAKGGTLENI